MAPVMLDDLAHPGRGPTLGIVGGMGPLASAEFLRTVYRFHLGEPEQASPCCILSSDPTIPDRTAAIREGLVEVLAERLAQAVADLLTAGATRVVIACVTVHCVLPMLPEPLRRNVVSLLDLTIDELLTSDDGPFLLLVTTGTRSARIFENHQRWREVAPRVLLPDEQDQKQLQAWIYELKSGMPAAIRLDWLESLRGRYGAAGLVFGCTELHLLQELIANGGKEADLGRIIDPLWIAARDLPRILADTR